MCVSQTHIKAHTRSNFSLFASREIFLQQKIKCELGVERKRASVCDISFSQWKLADFFFFSFFRVAAAASHHRFATGTSPRVSSSLFSFLSACVFGRVRFRVAGRDGGCDSGAVSKLNWSFGVRRSDSNLRIPYHFRATMPRQERLAPAERRGVCSFLGDFIALEK